MMLVGISGPSGSGKTTIARALRQVYAMNDFLCPSVEILHQDDFYKAEKDIPTIDIHAGKVVNWDCPEAVEMDAFIQALQSYRCNNAFADHVQKDLSERAKEDQNDRGLTGVSEALIAQLLQDSQIPTLREPLLIVDGFMLYQRQEVVTSLDAALLLRGSYHTLKARREARSGYVTLEGFWKDPQGYFDECVWPEYVANHRHFFQDENVHGPPLSAIPVVVAEKVDMDLDESFVFVLNAIRDYSLRQARDENL